MSHFLSSQIILYLLIQRILTTTKRDIMKLTALFTARRGRNFLATLSAKEGRNYQFDFLRPTHSLFGHFNRLVEQYNKVLYPSTDMLKQLKEQAQDSPRWELLEQARRHAKWQRYKREKDRKRKDDQEAERSGFSFFPLTILILSTQLQ